MSRVVVDFYDKNGARRTGVLLNAPETAELTGSYRVSLHDGPVIVDRGDVVKTYEQPIKEA